MILKIWDGLRGCRSVGGSLAVGGFLKQGANAGLKSP